MSWPSVSISLPASLQTVLDGLQGCRSSVPGELDNSLARLDAVKGSATIATNPAAATAANVTGLRASMNGLLQAGGRFVCVHPYIHPLGDRRGDYAYLTPQQAVDGMAAKLADPKDLQAGSNLRGVFLLLRGVDNAGFAGTLAAFNAVFPITELQLAERRAGWLATLEPDKFVQATGPIHPAWTDQKAHRHPEAVALEKALGGLLGMAEGYDLENTRPEEELAAVIEKKRAHLQELETAWATITDALKSGQGLGLVLDGNVGSIHRQLRENLPPVEGYKLAAVCCWLGNAVDMTFFRELLGL
ncbi:hypothetical protein [Pseudodesulfovibrio sp.]|uniref:hypothetical protein n=1 Tax=unclassified Pseudodesulfovibrio TaxID=2661612 RepID=UPI003B005253